MSEFRQNKRLMEVGLACLLPVASWPRRDVTKLVSEHGLKVRVSSMVYKSVTTTVGIRLS